MKDNAKYLIYVIKHKLFVFLAGINTGVPIWALVIHDWQKFTPTEWKPYVANFFGSYGKDERPEWLVESFNRA